MEKMITVLRVKPYEKPEVVTIENTLKALQSEVGGYIETVTLSDTAVLVCNEEGKLLGLPANRLIGNDIIVGDFIITGQSGSELASLPKEDIEAYTKMVSNQHIL